MFKKMGGIKITDREKIYFLKDTIRYLYEKEGRSKSYISRVLDIDRKTLSNIMNYEFKFTQAKIKRPSPSNQKFINKHKQLIKTRLDNNVPVKKISKELGVTYDYLLKSVIYNHEGLNDSFRDFLTRKKNNGIRKNAYKFSSGDYSNELEGEIFKEIKHHKGYQVSNMGRIRSYKKTYNKYLYLKPYLNKNGYYYIRIGKKNLKIHRLVAYHFVENKNNHDVVNHIDGDKTNNKADNLEWCSFSYNNKHSYKINNHKVIGYSRFGRFKKIILNNKYEFKTIVALAKFLGVSTTQCYRYISKETKNNYNFRFVY